jgi:hypothetical protein
MLPHGSVAHRMGRGFICGGCLKWLQDRNPTLARTVTGVQRHKSAL